MKKIILFLILLSFCKIEEKEKEIKGYLRVTALNGLILRAGPGTNFPKVKTLPRNTITPIYDTIGQTTEIKGFKGKWILTEYQKTSGYVFSGHVLITSNKESLENDSFNKDPITQFLISESGKDQIIKKLKEKNATFLNGNEIPILKRFYEDEFSLIETISFGVEYSPKTITRTIKGSNIIEFPDINNFHPIKIYESGKIIEGEYYPCYECCANTNPIIAIFTENKSISFLASASDTDALCYPEGGNTNFNRIRFSDMKNELYIQTKVGDCSEENLLYCYETNTTDSCKPKRYTSEFFKIIKNPFEDPIIDIYYNGIPDGYKKEFKNARKLIEWKVK